MRQLLYITYIRHDEFNVLQLHVYKCIRRFCDCQPISENLRTSYTYTGWPKK